MLNINNKYFNISVNKNNTQIKDGDIVRYSIMRKLDNDRALINIMGNKLTALFKNGMTDKGFALVSKKNGEITLTILKNAESLKEARESIQNKNNQNNQNVLIDIIKNNSEISSMLSQKGIKPSNENIRYFETILKYLPDLDINKKKFILNAMSNGVYLTVKEINSFGNIFKQFNDIINAIKNSNKNTEITEILVMLADSVIHRNDADTAEDLNNYINTNADFSIWFMLFDMLQGELSSDNSDMITLLLKILSSNKKNRNLKEPVFMFPMLFMIDDELKEVLLYIIKDDNNDKNNKFSFVMYDNEKEICKINIIKNEKYLLTIQLFSKKLYNKVNSIKENLYMDLSKFDNIDIKIDYAG